MLVFHQRIDPDSRTGRGSAWIAETIVAGTTYTARSRSGAPFELARRLVAADIPDQSVQIYTDGIAGFITHRSFAKMATRTVAESATVPVRLRMWSERDRIGVKNAGEADLSDTDTQREKNSVRDHAAVDFAE